MKYFKLISILFFLSNSQFSLANNLSELGNLEVSDVIDSGVIKITELQGSAVINQKDHRRSLRVGEEFFETSYIETEKETLIKLLLPNNTMIYLGPNSILKLHGMEGQSSKSTMTFEVIRGRVRMVGYKGNHYIKTPKGAVFFEHADIQWDVYREGSEIISHVKKYDGEIKHKGNDKVLDLNGALRPEKNVSAIDTVNRPWERWLGKIDSTHDYSIAYTPRFIEKKSKGRSLASVEVDEEGLDSSFVLMDEEDQEEQYTYPKVSKEIYVHENLFDSVLIEVQKVAQMKAKEVVSKAYKVAAEEIVWEVASRSLIRWGAQYAQQAALDEIPGNLKDMYSEIEKRDINFRKSKIYVDSVERVAALKSYTTAKNTIENKGTRKASLETQAYLLAMTNKIITPPMQYKVYLAAKEIAVKATDDFMKRSELVRTKDVDNLAEYLAQVAAKRFTQLEISKVEERISYEVANSAVNEAYQRGSDKIATFISEKVSKRTAQLFNKMLDQEVAQRAARSLASENQSQLGQKYRSNKSIEGLK